MAAVVEEKPAAEPGPVIATQEKPTQKLSESDDFTDNSVENANDAAREDTSQQSGLATVESEYDTASDSPSDGEEYDDQEEDSGESGEEEEMGSEGEDEEEDEEELEDGSDDDVIEVLDYERQSGDGQEQEAEAKKKVDDDEDRSNPQYIPKKGTFYEHDDRTAEDDDVKEVDDGTVKSDDASGTGEDRKSVDKTTAVRTMKQWKASAARWAHDRFDEHEQAPKSRAELVSAYGYDIRNEDGPPRARRRRRYARGPNRYTRNWEDGEAYTKSNNVEHNRQRKAPPRSEEFPELGANNTATSKSRSSLSKSSARRSSKQSLRSGDRADRGERGERGDRLEGPIDRTNTGGRQRDRNRISNNGGRSDGRMDRERDHRDRVMDRDRDDQYESQRMDRMRGDDRMDRERDRNWDRERDYDQHDSNNYREARNDGSRYSSDRVDSSNNYHNKENKMGNRISKEKERRGNDYKVITSLQFKNQTRNKGAESGLPISAASGGPQVVHSNSSGALSGSSNSNKMNNSMDRVQQVPDQRMMAPPQHHYANQPPQQQLIQQQQQQPSTIPLQQTQLQAQSQIQVQMQTQQLQHHQPSTYVNEDPYDSYSESKMPKDAKFPYNPPANATIQSVEIGQTDIAKYPPPAVQRTSKDRQQVLASSTGGVPLSSRSQISPRQIVSTQASQLQTMPSGQQLAQMPQQQYQQQLQQAQYQQLHPLTTQTGPPTAQAQGPQTQVPPPQLTQQQPPPTAAHLHNVHVAGNVTQQQMLPTDNNSRSAKRYSSSRQRSTLDNPNMVVVQSPLHEQQQQQLLQQQQQQQLLLQQELQHQQQKPKQSYPQPSLPLTMPNEYLVQSANQPTVPSKTQAPSQAPVQYQHAAAAYYSATTPAAQDYVAPAAPQPVQVPQQPTVPVVPQQLPTPQYSQYTQPSTASHPYIQAPPPATYIPQTTPTPQATPQPAAAAPPPNILNYVPSINPAATTQYPAAPYTGFQNYNAVVPQQVPPAVPINPTPSAATAALYQSSGGITYYAPQSQTQTPRPLPSQRRPTSAIPILAPPERKSKNNRSDNGSGGSNEVDDGSTNAPGSTSSGTATSNATSSADNIDHILDNMFVQRPPYQPPTRKSPSPAPTAVAASGVDGGQDTGDKDSTVDKIGDSVKKMTIQEEKLPLVDPTMLASGGSEKLDISSTPAVDPTVG
ncbi:uncharacterized protein LOC129747068 [Uranotaenia lowii]|uniref:uncharacterized protein LOC129747068 n=1 Tax=Uranotaenia lowii TaxID=190385 RepID=UPI002479916D|nr:uncharacterized protein LOC129747068 [Uranotaenia lowii]